MKKKSDMKVIYAPETYFKLAKMDYLQPYYQQQQDKIPEELALGGLYEKKGEEKNFWILSPGNFKVNAEDIQIFDEQKYDFRENETVYFKPTCSEKEKDYLLLTNKILIGEKYSIDRVINHFYVILQDYAGGLTNPIRFSDISKE